MAELGGEAVSMYEIRIDEPEGPVLAVHDDAAAALVGMNRIGDETMSQLAANGEGHKEFWLRLAVRDTSTGEDVAWAGIAR